MNGLGMDGQKSQSAGGAVGLLAWVGAAFYWAALPPLGWSGIGWFALLPWALIIAVPRPLSRREWTWIALASWGLWLGILYFIPIPHPALWLLWPLFAAFCGLYPVAFFISARFFYRGVRWPLWLAVPLTWAGLEWVRGNFLTGFGMAFLSHSQYQQPLVIQVAGLGGAYFLSFLLAMSSGLIAQGVLLERELRSGTLKQPKAVTIRRLLVTLGGVLLLFSAICLYGWTNLETDPRPTVSGEPIAGGKESPVLRALVIQGAIDTTFPETREELEAVFAEQFQQYRQLTIAARLAHPDAGLVIWPETIFVQPHYLPEEWSGPADPLMRQAWERARQEFSYCYQSSIGVFPGEAETEPACPGFVPLMTGLGVFNLETEESFNSVALIDETCQPVARYDKIHRVVVGEYLPFGEWFPWLYQFTPVGRGLTQGQGATAIEVSGVRFCPSICFESTVPHLIRWQVRELAAAGREPDVLVNSTNDGWFFGTSCLDLHLACNVFRAVEMGKPMVVAANTGFSAWIDHAGRILKQGPRRATGWFDVELQQGSGNLSTYRVLGDWPWSLCGWAAIAGLIGSWWRRGAAGGKGAQPV